MADAPVSAAAQQIAHPDDTASRDAHLAALKRELAHYEADGKTERAKQVKAEIDRLRKERSPETTSRQAPERAVSRAPKT